MGGDGHSTASEKLSKKSMLTDIQSVYVSQDKNPSHPEEYQIKKPGSESWIWWYSIHMAAESTEQKLEFRRGLEDLKKEQELTNDTRCELCVKVLKTGKLINHIKYFHNFSNFSLIDSFTSTTVKFNFNDNTLTLEHKESSPTDSSSTKCFTMRQSSTQEEYGCVKCNIVYADSGAHLLFQHGMLRCRVTSCDKYFDDEHLRSLHEESQHSQAYPCSVCNKICTSQYHLVVHKSEEHSMQTCIFCDAMILTSLEPFANHLHQHHYIKNNKLVHNARMVPVIHRLINFPLILFDPTALTVHCCLCDSYKFDCVHGGEELVRYLTEFHHIKHSDRIENAEIIGDIGKFPVYMKCEVCGVILTSILNSTTHMKKLHKDSGQEKNKLFTCDICHQGFYFQSSLNSHKSKAHQETSGITFRCPLCTSVTNSKNGMRRHLRNSHKRTDLLNEELS